MTIDELNELFRFSNEPVDCRSLRDMNLVFWKAN